MCIVHIGMIKVFKKYKIFSPTVEVLGVVSPDAAVADEVVVADFFVVVQEEEAFFSALETSSFSQLSSIRFLGGGDLLEPRPWQSPFVTTSSFFLFLSAVVCFTEAFVVFKFELEVC